MRHALRARGVVLVCGGRATTAFDLYPDRKLRYSIANGGPDAATLEDGKGRLTEMVKATMEYPARPKAEPGLQSDAQSAGAGVEVVAHR